MIEINKNPIVQLENETVYQQSIYSNVQDAVVEEQELLAATVTESSQLVTIAGASSDLSEQISSRVTHNVLIDLQNLLDRYQTHLQVDRREPVSSEINHWSDISFSRLALGNIEFNRLLEMDDRARELENYLDAIDKLLEETEGEVEE